MEDDDGGTVTLSLSECRITLSRSGVIRVASLSSLSAAPGWENEIFTTMSFRFFCQHDKVRLWGDQRVDST